MNKRQGDFKALQYLFTVAGRTNLLIVLLAVIHAAQSLISVSYALILREIINAAVAGERQEFFNSILLFAVMVIIRLILSAANRYLSTYARSTFENRFKRRLFSTLLNKDYERVTAVHSGEWMNRVTSDTSEVAEGLTGILPGLVGMLVRLAGASAAILILEPRFLYFVIPCGIVLIVLSLPFRNIMKRMHKDIREKDGLLRVFMQEILGSMIVVRSFGVQDDVLREADEKMEDHKKARTRRSLVSVLCHTGVEAVMNGARILVALICGWGILTGTMSYGSFAAIWDLIGQLQSPFSGISGYLPRYYAMIASAERLMEAEELPDSNTEDVIPLSEIQKRYAEDFQSIGLDGASFTYLPLNKEQKNEMPVILKNVTLDIKKGDFVALAGPSGCGKSTMLKVLMCLYPLDSGERYVRLADGTRNLTESWQKLFAYVPQGNHLMSGTIREIIAFSDKDQMYDDMRIWQALKMACADEFVSELEDGLDSLLGENGLGLSEGQMQRLAIARAIFSGYPILMLDECTSALDHDTERKLLDNLKEMTDRTVFIVTHRPAALEICDKVVRFSMDGSIWEEDGTIS